MKYKKLIYQGLLSIHCYEHEDDYSEHGYGRYLYLSSVEPPLFNELKEKIKGKQVTVRYWITDKPCWIEEAQEQFLKKLHGLTNIKFDAQYSEYTGYLWTTENCEIGGHDLKKELKSHIGKWLILEIEIH